MITDGDSRRTAWRETVVTVRVTDVAASAHRVIDLLGGMSSILDGRHIAILKPNFVAGRPARTGATTNLDLIAAVAEEVRAAGAEPMLLEFPGTEFDPEATWSILGLDDFCAKHRIGFVKRIDRWLELRPAGARRLKRFRVPAILKEAALFNLPVLKTHVVSGMSIAMKNPMGMLPTTDRRTMHTFGIQQSIVDMNRGIVPDLNIVDGTVGQDGEGPLYGHAANLGVLVGGRDSLSVDVVSCRLAGVDPMDVEHMRLAAEQMGSREPVVLGDEIEPIASFEIPRGRALYRFAFWLMYPLDYPYKRLTGKHLCTAVYETGLVGTRPQIVESACTRCGACVTACPIPDVINLSSLTVNPKTCQRCLLCVEACPEGAITVRGWSGERTLPRPAAATVPGDDIAAGTRVER